MLKYFSVYKLSLIIVSVLTIIRLSMLYANPFIYKFKKCFSQSVFCLFIFVTLYSVMLAVTFRSIMNFELMLVCGIR